MIRFVLVERSCLFRAIAFEKKAAKYSTKSLVRYAALH